MTTITPATTTPATTLAECLADMRRQSARPLSWHIDPDTNDDAYAFAVRYAAWVDGEAGGLSVDDNRTATSLGWML